MRKLYTRTITSKLNLKNGKTITTETSQYESSAYAYGEMPKKENLAINDWENFIKDCTIGMSKDPKGIKRMFSKRYFVPYDQNLFRIDVYEDNFVSVEITAQYNEVPLSKYPSIDKLRKILSFEEYTQLIFDRENQLKSLV